jgi:undecaprenyl-diphosphatase
MYGFHSLGGFKLSVCDAAFLGLIQALGEFLPVSSSAHLALFSFFTGGAYQGVTYDVALHFATLIAVIAYFWKDLLHLTVAGLSGPGIGEGRLFWYIGLATAPAAMAGFLFEEEAENIFRSPLLIAFMLAAFACLLLYADKRSAKRADKRTVFGLAPMLLIGCAQALALMPGVSRSGVTITAALLLGFGRGESARVSFLLAIPVIAGAVILKLRHINAADINAAFAAGFVTALICGWLVIKFLMKYIQTRGFGIFVYYRWVLAAAIAATYFIKG